MQLRGKTALVTGGAVRIGRAVCEALAASGCNVVVHFHRSQREATTLAGILRHMGVQAWTLRGELGGQASCERLMDRAWKKAGAINLLVNNAAIFRKFDLWSVTQGEAEAELRADLLDPMFMIQAFARRQRARRSQLPHPAGKVVNLLDRRIASDDPSCLPYLLAKKALATLTGAAALELAPAITVNGVAPGPVLPPPGKSERALHDASGQIPLARRPTPADVAQAVVFLFEADAVTGQVLFVDGGQHLLGNRV